MKTGALTILLAVFCLSTAAAQSDAPESPFTATASKTSPAARPVQTGVFGGGVFTFSSGVFTAGCNCGYTGGSGLAPAGGAFLLYPLSHAMAVELRAGYGASYTRSTLTDNRSFFSGVGEGAQLSFERAARVTVQSVQFALLGVWNPGGSDIAIQAGLAVGIPGANTLKETEEITTPGWVYPDTRTSVAVITDGKLSDLHTMRGVSLGVQVGASYDIPLTGRLGVAPEIGYVFPLTSVLEDAADWKLHALLGFVRVRWSL